MLLHPDNASAQSSLSPEIAAEVDAAMKAMDQADAAAVAKAGLPGAKPAIRGPRVIHSGREHRTGKVVSVGPTDIFIEFGPKELGIVTKIQWPEDEIPAVGSEISVVVDKFEAAESLFICSRPGSVQKAAWEMLEPGQVVEARVTGVNKGGLEMEVGGHAAFMPASQVSLDHVKDLSVFVGEKWPCAVSRVDRTGRGNVVLSRREVLNMERKEQATKLRDTLQEGQTIEGTVRKIMPFGAFVDIGGVDGLIHITDLTYDRVGFGEKAVAKFVQEGQRVTVRIMKLDWEGNRISLGLKQTASDPFATAVNTIAEGAEITGRVTKLLEFGAFVEITPGVEGLVHISELDHRRVANVGEVVKQDEIVRAKVIKIDKDNRRVSLSIKALKPLPEMNLGGGGGGGGGGGAGGKGGKGGDRGKPAGRTVEEIKKETPALRRLREQAKMKVAKFKGGLG
jgi:small subunit ribosomal protein S1